MPDKIKTIKEWKDAANHQFTLAPESSLIRISDNQRFYMGYGYNADGYIAGTTIEIIGYDHDMIHVHIEIISGNDETICMLDPEINRLIMSTGNTLYILPEPDCKG